MNKRISEYTTKELRQICQYSAAARERESKVGLFSRVFSIYFTRLFLYTSITPNQMTILSTLVFFGGLAVFLFNDYYLNIIGALLVFLSIILDGCDGEIARFKKNGGNIGALYVEPVSHDVQYGFVFLIIAWAVVLGGGSPYYFVLGAIAGITKLLYRLLEKNYWMSAQKNITHEEIVKIKKAYSKKSAIVRLIYWVNKNFFSSTAIFPLLLLFSLIGHIELFLWYFAIGYAVLWLALFAKQIYQINKLK